MLKRVNSALFTAPVGAQIRIVVQPQGNNGVNDATFEYASQSVTKQTILGLRGCTINVRNGSHQFQAGVVFDPAAPGSARYDMFEVENGAKLSLGKFVRHSESSPKIAFALKATAPVPVGAAVRRAPVPAAAAASLVSAADSLESAAASLESAAAALEEAPPAPMADGETALKTVKQQAAGKKTARKKATTRKGATKTTATRKTARKKTARKKTVRKQAPRKSARKTAAAARQKASRKRR